MPNVHLNSDDDEDDDDDDDEDDEDDDVRGYYPNIFS